MEKAFDIINQVLPILFLIALGFWIRKKHFLSDKTINELRKIVLNLALPAVLFVSFLNMELKKSYLLIFGLIFLLCIVLLLLGFLVKKLFKIEYDYFPYLTTGFEYGMLGISLFGAAYGLDKIGFIAITALGHEIFIWFIFVPLLLLKRDGAQKPKEILRSFISAPVVIAILLSMLLNGLGFRDAFYQLPLSGALIPTFNFLGNLTVPLILIIVGYGFVIDRETLKDAFGVIAIRLSILLPMIFLINHFLIQEFLQLEPFFQIALFTLFILPPPFIVALYARTNLAPKEKQYINNVLTIHTAISVGLFLIYFTMNPV
ncbi:MAG: AEC family transporter [Anaerolineaceae bacterium]|nr:AEC family transporter [Anaerolineaceae bacterium]